MKTTTCRGCGQQIWFGLTTKGRRLPLDVVPSPKGNVVIAPTLFAQATADEPGVEVLPVPDPARPGYLSHFATCPDAERFRRRRGGGR